MYASFDYIDDPDFGSLNHYVDSWHADIPFDTPPIESAHIHIQADDSGPTKQQHDLIAMLLTRHSQLWPDICSALVKFHPEIKTIEELSSRLVRHIGINLYDDSNTIEITSGFAVSPPLDS